MPFSYPVPAISPAKTNIHCSIRTRQKLPCALQHTGKVHRSYLFLPWISKESQPLIKAVPSHLEQLRALPFSFPCSHGYEFTRHRRTCFCISPTPLCLLYQDIVHTVRGISVSRTKRRCYTVSAAGKTRLPSRFIFRTHRLTIFHLIVFQSSLCSGHFSHRLPFYFPRTRRRDIETFLRSCIRSAHMHCIPFQSPCR